MINVEHINGTLAPVKGEVSVGGIIVNDDIVIKNASVISSNEKALK